MRFDVILPPDGLNDWNDAIRAMAPVSITPRGARVRCSGKSTVAAVGEKTKSERLGVPHGRVIARNHIHGLHMTNF